MWFLSLRHLFSKPKQTVLTLLAIVFGTMSFVVISSFFDGFQSFLLDQLINNDAHVKISAQDELTKSNQFNIFLSKQDQIFFKNNALRKKESKKIENPRGWDKILKLNPEVIAYTPQLTNQGLISRATTEMAVSIVGTNPLDQVKVTKISSNMTVGEFSDLASGGNRIIVGSLLMEKLGASINDNVRLTVNQKTLPFKVIGVFKSGLKALDEATVYLNLSDAQILSGKINQINQISVKLKNFNDAKAIASDLRQFSSDKIESWDQVNESFLNVIKIQNASRYMMISVIILIGCFGIYNILNAVVGQKQKEIAILQAMGFLPKEILILFLSQGFLLGIIGGILGLLFGYLMCLYLTTVPFSGGPTAGSSGFLNISFDPVTYAYAMAMSILSAVFASSLPARKASKMMPIDIIRAGTE
jgi:lipoprotein-releasing system permease protein